MALMYDMETVNRAMTEAAKLYDPKHKSATRVKKVLGIFAAMKPQETVHAYWVLDHVNRWGRWTRWLCSNCLRPVEVMGCNVKPNGKKCLHCGASMDGRVEA